MKMGLFITNQQTLDTDMAIALDDQFAMVRFARDRGWDSLFSGQHYLNEGNNRQLQMVPLLARLAAEAGEMDDRSGHSAAQPAQSRLHGGDGGDARHHRQGQLHLRRRLGLPRH
jgi:hypothetical protein